MEITLAKDQALVGKPPILGQTNFPIQDLCRVIADNTINGLHPDPLPDNVRWFCQRGERSIYIFEFEPALHSVLWGADGWEDEEGCWCYEHETPTRYTVAMPYVVVTIPFYGNHNLDPQVHYRNHPLRSLDDPLFRTNLMNVSEGYGGMCTHPEIDYGRMSRQEILGELLNSIWGGEFNGHLAGSHWHQFLDHTHDPRLMSIETWQAASLKDPKFVLDVKWLGSQYTPRRLIHRFLGPDPAVTEQLGGLLLQT